MKGKYLIIIPIVIGILLGIYVTNYFQTDFRSDNLLLTNQELLKNGSPKIGISNANISIVEFGDYQCTFCYKFHQNTFNDIKTQYVDTGKINYVYRDFPLNGYDSSLAAEATYCADDQDKYWQYHNLLFSSWAGEKTGWITLDSLENLAIKSDLNISEFNKCLNGHKYYQKVIDNENYAKKIGINATPSFLIFDYEELVRIIGAQEFEEFQNVIEYLISK